MTDFDDDSSIFLNEDQILESESNDKKPTPKKGANKRGLENKKAKALINLEKARAQRKENVEKKKSKKIQEQDLEVKTFYSDITEQKSNIKKETLKTNIVKEQLNPVTVNEPLKTEAIKEPSKTETPESGKKSLTIMLETILNKQQTIETNLSKLMTEKSADNSIPKKKDNDSNPQKRDLLAALRKTLS